MMLAAAGPADFWAGVNPLDALAREHWEDLLMGHPTAVALLCLPLGLALVLYGFKVYRWLIIATYAAVGVLAGLVLARAIGLHALLGMTVGGLALGLVAWPLHRLCWGVLGGFVFALSFMVLASLFGVRSDAYVLLVGAVAGVAGLVLTLLLFRPLIIIVSALAGAALLVDGAVRVACFWPSVGEPMLVVAREKPYIFVLVILGLAAVGAALQWQDTGKAKGKAAARKPKKGESGGA